MQFKENRDKSVSMVPEQAGPRSTTSQYHHPHLLVLLKVMKALLHVFLEGMLRFAGFPEVYKQILNTQTCQPNILFTYISQALASSMVVFPSCFEYSSNKVCAF